MRRIITLSMLFLLVGAFGANAQRYLEEVFDEVTVTEDILYGVNASVLAYPIFNEAIPVELRMDVYEPAGDTETARPLILYFHTGNFLPHPENLSPSGLRDDSATVEVCTRFAKMGYVVASCDYRLGWNPLAETQDERVFTLINAAYRGVQDSRTAARFFRKEHAENDNPWGIDPDKFVVWGQGTGGYISLATSTIDAYEDILLPKFITTDGEGNPLPMVIEQVNGNVDGTTFGVNPLDNDTLCYPNHVGYDSDFQACVNMGGALGDISWLDENDGPFISFQAPTDPFAPYETATLIVPGVNLPVVEVMGAYVVQETCADFGNNDVFANTNLQDAYTVAADAINDGYDGLFPFNRPAGAEADSAPWEWWDPENNPNHDQGIQTNPDMSPEKGRTFIDTIQFYTAPRLACALGLPNNPCGAGGNAPANDMCMDSEDINSLFGGDQDVTNTAGPFSNVDATPENDLDDGYLCFEDNNNLGPLLNNTVWFTFTGDGETYSIATSDCDDSAEFFQGDTQIAVYSGACDNLTPVACNEDIDFDGGDYYSSVTIETEAGVEYFVLVDGYDYTEFDSEPATGDFCVEVTNTIVSVSEINAIGMQMYPNPSDNVVRVNADQQITGIEVFDLTGKTVEAFAPQAVQTVLNVSEWESGVYLIQVTTEQGTATQRFIRK